MKSAVVIAVIAALVALAAATRADSQDLLPEESAFATACATAEQIGQIGAIDVSHCRRVAEVVEGNRAIVIVKVKAAGVWYAVTVAFIKSAWGQTAIDIRPA